MRPFISLLLMLNCTNALAVDWDEVLPSELESKGIFIESECLKLSACASFEIKLPRSLFFEDLGAREFYSAFYIGMEDGTITFPLSGTRLGLRSAREDGVIVLEDLCVSSQDLDRAYISASYIGAQGALPMAIYFKLKIN